MGHMTIDKDIKFGNAAVSLSPAPINPDWILEGKPVARNKLLSTSADGTATTLIWDCTPGRFNWFYNIDETLFVLEGSVTLKDPDGNSRLVVAGDTIFFPAGSQAEWTVHTHFRKVAFCRTALPAPLVFALRFRRSLKRMLGGAKGKSEGLAMFGNG
jgi:uncharacterized cupin superfamily protein